MLRGKRGFSRTAVPIAALVLAVALMLLGLARAGRAPVEAGARRYGRRPPRTGTLQATIRRTSHGIPHILADDFAGLGYGYGYSLAQDNICVVADTYVTVRRRALALLRPGRLLHGRAATAASTTTSTATSSTSGSSTTARSSTCSTLDPAARPAARRSRSWCAATSPATTGTCARPASTTSPTRAAAARPGCGRSPRWTSTGASTSSA